MILPRSVPGHIMKRYLTFIAKIGAWDARCGVEGNQPGVQGCLVNASPTRRSSLRAVCRVEPHRYASVHQSIAVVPSRIDLRVVCPLERSRFGIDRDHAIEAGGKHQKAIDEDWCSFESASLFSVFAVGNITGMKDPGDFEPRHVLRIELGQPRVAHPTGVTSVVW